MVFTFPPDFEQRCRSYRRKQDFKTSLMNAVCTLVFVFVFVFVFVLHSLLLCYVVSSV